MSSSPQTHRLRLQILGAVQGVGFRPFVYRLARGMGLAGWVNNSARGVSIEVEGPRAALDEFLVRLEREKPPRSFLQSLEASLLDPVGYRGFQVRDSSCSGETTALVLPDIATCPECLAEVLDPGNRRYRYPFTNCTNCGPRFSIIEGLPYDRPRTTMRAFSMCPECRREYEDPSDRRFHAQPNACPACGPQLALLDGAGNIAASDHEALCRAAERIRRGAIVAVKGLGGFHLVVDARSDGAVERLRSRKHREEKPFALMFPSVDAVRAVCEVSPLEERLLRSAESPIVLLSRRADAGGVSLSVAPHNPSLGALLPYTPLHHLLLRETGFAVVATSGNISDEPICTDEREALERLGGIADVFLVHDRPIARHVDDSIARIVAGRELVLRRARGYAPLPHHGERDLGTILGVGAHLKNTVALSVGRDVFLSQHIGDLESAESMRAFRSVIESFQSLYGARPESIACDLHPDYLSTRYARRAGIPVRPVQHHHAHVVSCMAENELDGTVLGVSWDGTGYGADGTIWGGEFLAATRRDFERVAHLRPFRLPGGETAIREPRRTALGLLAEIFDGDLSSLPGVASLDAFSTTEKNVLLQMIRSGVNAPLTSSAGRLFDAAASLSGLRHEVRFEGQAAMELEFALAGERGERRYPVRVVEGDSPRSWIVDWEPAILALLEDARHGLAAGKISLGFHNTLVDSIVEVASRVGLERVVLSGGCFQNRYLTEQSVARLQAKGFRPYWHQRVPPNDGGVALGQVVAAARQPRLESTTGEREDPCV